jgi:hypothetical protein
MTGAVFSRDGREIVATHLNEQVYVFDTARNYEQEHAFISPLHRKTGRSDHRDRCMLDYEAVRPQHGRVSSGRGYAVRRGAGLPRVPKPPAEEWYAPTDPERLWLGS